MTPQELHTFIQTTDENTEQGFLLIQTITFLSGKPETTKVLAWKEGSKTLVRPTGPQEDLSILGFTYPDHFDRRGEHTTFTPTE